MEIHQGLREVKVKEMEISLVKGEKYRVRLEGWWGTVWVGEGELRAGEGRMGDFKSEGIEVQVPEIPSLRAEYQC